MKLPQKYFLPASLVAAFITAVGALYAADASIPAPGAVTAEAAAPAKRTMPFILGADISYVPQDEAAGATYWDNGVQMDIFDILKKYKFNYVRLRTFVDVTARGGYAARGEPFCDLEHTKVMAKRAQAAGMKVLIDLHLGDTWTSPGHQAKPAAWVNLAFPEMLKAVHDYAYNVVSALKAQGTTPDMVQVGNEISDGALFPDGHTPNWDNFAAILKAGIAGVKEVDPKIPVMIHNHLGRDNAKMREWLDHLIQRGVQFEIIGMSCYAQGSPGDWEKNFNDLATRYPDKYLVAAEYSGHKQYINDLLYHAPNNRGLGSFIWEPTRWKIALFDHDGQPNSAGIEGNDLSAPNDPGIERFHAAPARGPGAGNRGARRGAAPNGTAPTPAGTAPAASGPAPTAALSGLDGQNRLGAVVVKVAASLQDSPSPATPPVAQPATSVTTVPPSPTTTAPAATGRNGAGFGRRNGGRYDTNELIKLYPEMSKAYGNDAMKGSAGAAKPATASTQP